MSEQYLGINVQKVYLRSLAINEELDINPAQLEISIGAKNHLNMEKHLLLYEIKPAFYHTNEEETPVVTASIVTIFGLENIDAFINPETKNAILPEQAHITMLGIAISHARALLAQNTNGTKHENLILPIVSPKQVYNNMQSQNED